MKNPLDLNNLPEDYSERWREGKQVLEETALVSSDSSSMDDKIKETIDESKKRKCGAKEGKEACGKVYECRFCSLKFCKSQALGGHMNRHRQERETETLIRARQLVYSNENMGMPGLNMGLRDQNHAGSPAIPAGNFHQTPIGGGGSSEPPLPFPSHFNRPPSPASPSFFSPPPRQPFLYNPSTSRLVPFPAQFPPYMNDYLIGHVLPSHHSQQNPANYRRPTQGSMPGESNSGRFTCVFPTTGEMDSSYNQVEGTGWDEQSPTTMQHRFQDNF